EGRLARSARALESGEVPFPERQRDVAQGGNDGRAQPVGPGDSDSRNDGGRSLVHLQLRESQREKAVYAMGRARRERAACGRANLIAGSGDEWGENGPGGCVADTLD